MNLRLGFEISHDKSWHNFDGDHRYRASWAAKVTFPRYYRATKMWGWQTKVWRFYYGNF